MNLKACPFCGSNSAPMIDQYDELNFGVVCSLFESGCGAHSVYRRTEEEAADAWNRRESILIADL